MLIDEVTSTQIGLLMAIVNSSPLFSVAYIPEDHPHFKDRGDHYNSVCKNIEHLAELQFVEDWTNKDGEHQAINEAIERQTGYEYKVYAVTKLGILLGQSYANEIEKEMKYKNSIS